MRQTCEFEAEGKACFYRKREERGWGKERAEVGCDTRGKSEQMKVHAGDVGEEEWRARVILAGLRRCHGRGKYMG